jgi:hypothetical protein
MPVAAPGLSIRAPGRIGSYRTVGHTRHIQQGLIRTPL